MAVPLLHCLWEEDKESLLVSVSRMGLSWSVLGFVTSGGDNAATASSWLHVERKPGIK